MKQVRIADLFDFLPKSKIQAGDGLDEGKYPFYTSSENQTKYLNEFQHEPGCLVFGTGGKASIHFPVCHFSTSTDCFVIRPKSDIEIDAGYVFQYFKGDMQVLESGFKGAGLRHISKAYLSNIPVPYPEDLDDQKRIAHLLGKAEGLIAQRKQHLQQLDDLLKSVFLEMFGDPVRNEKGWRQDTASGYAKMVSVGVVVRPASYYVETGVVALRSLNIKPNHINLDDLVYFSKEVNEGVLSKSRLKTNDVVIVRTGKTGTAAVVPAKLEGANCIDLIIVRPKQEKINPQYLSCLLNSERGMALVASREVGGIQKHFNVGALTKIPFPLPPIDLQNQFAVIVEKVESIKSRYQQSRSDLEQLYGVLSQKAFKGELDLSSINIELKETPVEPAENPTVTSPQENNKEIDWATIIGATILIAGGIYLAKKLYDYFKEKGREELAIDEQFLQEICNKNIIKKSLEEMQGLHNFETIWNALKGIVEKSIPENCYLSDGWERVLYDHVKGILYELIRDGFLVQKFHVDESDKNKTGISLQVKHATA